MENAKLYSIANGMQRKDAEEILTEFQDKLKWSKGARILDVGCGSGEVTTEILLPRLPKDFGELTGLDISLEMIRHARNSHFHPRVSFVRFDIAKYSDDALYDLCKLLRTRDGDGDGDDDDDDFNLKRSNGEITLEKQKVTTDDKIIKSQKNLLPGYDVISSFYCLHWIPNQRLAVKNMYELLKPGGEALLVFLVKCPIFVLYRKLSTIDRWKKYMQDVDDFVPSYQDSENPLDVFAALVKTVGFAIVTSDCRERNFVFDNFTSLRNAIAAVNPFISRIPNDLREDFFEECLRQIKILKLTNLKNNTLNVSYKLIVAHVRKPE